MKKNITILLLLILAVAINGIILANLLSFAKSENAQTQTQEPIHLGPTVDNVCIQNDYIYDDYCLGNSIGNMNFGETIKTISIADGWAKINYNGQLAYVKADTLVDKDTYLLAQICYAEAGCSTKDELAKVGQVVINRVNSQYWEFQDCNSILDVVTQDGQYPETWDKIRNGLEPSEDAIEVAKGLLNGSINSGLSADVLWQTGFVPTWNAQVVLETEWHYYSVLKED